MSETGYLESAGSIEFEQPQMIRIPEGCFLMGSESGQDNEKPVHPVWVDAFELAACQVTQAEYARFVAASGRPKLPHWDDPCFSLPEQPVVATSWFDATEYCEWLSRITGNRYRLPSEAEWERAARGGLEQESYPCRAYLLLSQHTHPARWKTGPEPVGRSEQNEYGIFDIGANVHEWCADWFSPDYYSASEKRNPKGPQAGLRRASRGGSWRHYIKVSRCAARSSIPPEFRYADYGFRIARDLL